MSSGFENLKSASASVESKPQKPSESECCGSGCKICVFDIYERRLKAWEEEQQQQRYRGSSQPHDVESLLSPVTYKPFVLKNIRQVTEDSFCYRFCAPTEYPLKINLGQHVILRASVQGEEIFRQYTPINDMETPGYFDLLIKLYPIGLMSQHMKEWHIGTVAEFKGPFGSFSGTLLKKWSKLCLLASGTGIAPMSAIIKSIVNNEENETMLQLLFACRFYENILLKEDIDKWADYWNFRVLYCLSQEQESTSLDPYEERLHFGRITKTLLESKVEDIASNFFLICGSRVFNKDMVNFLTELGLSEEQYFIF